MKVYNISVNQNYIESVTYYAYSGNELAVGQPINKVVIRQYSSNFEDDRPGTKYFAHIDEVDISGNPINGWIDVDSNNQYKIVEAYLTGVGNIDQYWACTLKRMKRQ